LVSPVTVIGELVPLAVIGVPPPAGVAVTVYPVIGEPPLSLGAVKLTVALPLLPLALIPVGTPGAIAGVTGADAVELALVPAALVAVAVKV
jgi:hypothetical protein